MILTLEDHGDDLVRFWPSLVGAALIIGVHLCTPRLRFMRKPGNVWVPASAGVALAYVFMDIFPHLAKAKAKLASTGGDPAFDFLTRNIYLLCLVGFAVYLGVILIEKSFRESLPTSEVSFRSAPTVVKVESVSLAGYSFLVGYLLSEEITHRVEPSILFGLAMAVHFAGLNHLMRGHFPKLYDGALRFMLAASVLAGWAAGILLEMEPARLDLGYAFLAGGIIVVAAVYELPHVHTQKQYWAFVVGAGVFATMILLLKSFGH